MAETLHFDFIGKELVRWEDYDELSARMDGWYLDYDHSGFIKADPDREFGLPFETDEEAVQYVERRALDRRETDYLKAIALHHAGVARAWATLLT